MNQLKSKNILFLEDNMSFANNTIEFLNIYFEKVIHCSSVKKALTAFNEHRVDVIISDIKVEDGSGLDFISKVRDIDLEVPIVILSAHKDEAFLFKAIPLNITSYELKPLNYDNFINLLIKLNSSFEVKQTVALSKNLEYDFKKHEILLDKEVVNLTKKEALFIELLLKHSDDIATNEMIQNTIWENKLMSDAAVKNFVFRLRKKLKHDVIITVQGFGYRLNS